MMTVLCPKCGFPMLYAPMTDSYGCLDKDCLNANGRVAASSGIVKHEQVVGLMTMMGEIYSLRKRIETITTEFAKEVRRLEKEVVKAESKVTELRRASDEEERSKLLHDELYHRYRV